MPAPARDDTLDGGQGNDTLDRRRRARTGSTATSATTPSAVTPATTPSTAATGADALVGGDGDDTVRASDGYADQLDCGAGQDTAVVDQLDTVNANCEQVSRQQVTPGPGPDRRQGHHRARP